MDNFPWVNITAGLFFLTFYERNILGLKGVLSLSGLFIRILSDVSFLRCLIKAVYLFFKTRTTTNGVVHLQQDLQNTLA